MKKLSFGIFFWALFLLCGSNIYSQKEDPMAWRQARWGMSNIELEQAFKGEVQKLAVREDFSQFYADLAIRDYDILNNKFTVFFQMDTRDKKLAQILIRLNKGEIIYPDTNLFVRLQSLLTSKYGKPAYSTDDVTDKDSGPVVRERGWTTPSATIELNYTWLLKQSGWVYIRYSKPSTHKV